MGPPISQKEVLEGRTCSESTVGDVETKGDSLLLKRKRKGLVGSEEIIKKILRHRTFPKSIEERGKADL